MHRAFHLSIGVKSIEESILFFEDVLKSKVLHRDPSGYVNIDFYGSQITLKSTPGIEPDLKELHFGVNLCLNEFEQLAEHILETKYKGIVDSPTVVEADTKMERTKMYVKCPTGYLFEIKGYK